MAEPVDAVLFDLDDTLCAYRRSGDELLADAFATEDVEPFFGIEEYYDRFETFAARHDSIDDLRASCFATIAAERGHDPAVGRVLATRYAAARDHRDVVFRSGARETLGVLSNDHRLGVVTNGGPGSQKPKLDGLGLHDRFETVVFAGHDTARKPAAEPFHHALETLDVQPGRAVHVGNSFDTDVVGAHAAGLRSVWVPTDRDGGADGTGDIDGSEPTGIGVSGAEGGTDGDLRADYTLGSLRELTTPPWR